MTPPQGFGSFWHRLVKGTRWTWRHARYENALPGDLDETVMSLESRDRFHAKQGRSTARVVFHGPGGSVPVYLKRHFQLPWLARLAALVDPRGHHTPGAAEFGHLETARNLGLAVPDVVAVGERIGPWGALQSFLMVAELTDSEPLHEAIPKLSATMEPEAFARLKRELCRESAAIAARLHNAHAFHKDLYLCHFFIDKTRLDRLGERLTVIDLHRLAIHKLWPDRWRWKDLGQLLYSTDGVAGISRRDALRFWIHYRRLTLLKQPKRHAKMIRWKAARYLRHNVG